MADDPGLAPLSPAPSLDGMSSEERVEAMVEWFFENFQDPAQETSYNGREGGYIYVHGGPYEADDYVHDHFPDATDEEREEAIDLIDEQGPEFAPAGHRILPPDEDENDFPPSPPLEARLDALAVQLEQIRGHVAQIAALRRVDPGGQEGPPSIGHNNPPADDEPDFDEIVESIREVEVELARPDRSSGADPEVLERAEGRFRRFLKWVKAIVVNAPTQLANGALQFAGGAVAAYVVGHHAEIVPTLEATADTMTHWICTVTGIF